MTTFKWLCIALLSFRLIVFTLKKTPEMVREEMLVHQKSDDPPPTISVAKAAYCIYCFGMLGIITALVYWV